MRLVLDNAKCQGHGRCMAVAPELFESDEEGYAVLLVEGPIAADQEAHARLAEANCPEFAIQVEE